MGRLPGWSDLDLAVSPTVMRPRQSSVSSVGSHPADILHSGNLCSAVLPSQLPLCHQPNLQWSLLAMTGAVLFQGGTVKVVVWSVAVVITKSPSAKPVL